MKLTRRQLEKLIMESLELHEARVPSARRIVRKIEDTEKKIDELLKDPKANDEELRRYLDRLEVARRKRFGNRRDMIKVKELRKKLFQHFFKMQNQEEFGAENKDEPTSGTESLEQRPSGESEPKGKKTRKTRAERKANRKEIYKSINTTLGELKKKLEDETNKRRKQTLQTTIDFLDGRLKKLKKGEDVTGETIPPEVEKVLSTEEAKQILDTGPNEYEKFKSNPPSSGEDEDNPNKGKQTLNQTPNTDFVLVTDIDEIKKAIKETPFTNNGDGSLLKRLSIAAIDMYDASGASMAILGDNMFKSPEDFLNSGSGTADYFDENGKSNSDKFDFKLFAYKSQSTGETTCNLYIDGTALYNASIKDYAVVKIKGDYFVIHKSKIETEKQKVLPESFTRFNGMNLGESRASLYRKRYWGRY